MNEEEKKAIEELSKKAVICNYEERDYPNMICFKKDMIIVLNLIEKLQKENEEVKRLIAHKNEYTKKLEEYLFENAENYVISKQKVKDKIEELKKKVEELTDDKGYWGGSDLLEQIKVLQELLEKEQ